MKFSELVQNLNINTDRTSLLGHPECDPEVQGIAPIDQATRSTISYIEGAKFAARLKTTEARVLILPPDHGLQRQATERGIAWIGASEPRLLFARAIALFYQPWKPAPEIHASAVIHPEAQVGEGVYIGAHVVIQARVRIGNGVCIHPNVVIYPDVQIGDRTILHANCTIHERSQIGADCVIHSGAVIGAEGFGFVPTKEGWFKMEQSGYTVLEDGVEIGCNTTIDRPAVGETRIGGNTKIDNLVQIGHGCQVGGACAIAAQVGLAGGVNVGNRVILAGQVGIANQAKIGDGAIASAKSGIHNNVEAGAIVSGIPAVPHKLFLKVSAIYHRLPQMYQTLKELKKNPE
ncbi:MAG: UDP-3-O-(3-hydroxymyristoyl)glucosamine N-acyltransferase [Coleofasciculus sp. A1-SPW-01]|uniref:UDP-3-O-(3-hydroxymyristoyl)glucosamine N-acyltransferase n=1 Tax=Coleofasciculus sp. A1-SPW-01 TaxID=3070819 RepID=UPI0032F75A96